MIRKILFTSVLVVVLLGLTLGMAAASGLVGVQLPKPAGPYAVGRASYDLLDPTRPETFGNDPSARREIVATIYYPAVPPAGARPAPYAEPKMAALLAGKVHLPAAIVALIHSHAYTGVPIAAGQFPVVLFLPGIGTPPLEYTSSVEDLASRGYVVVVLYPTYSVPFTVFSDGRVAQLSEAGFRSENEPAGTSDAQIEADRDAIGSVWVADARFALDQLTQFNTSDPLLKGHLDLDQTGIYGHSFGGATAAEALRVDKRFKAGINMDGAAFSLTDSSQIGQPFMWMASDYSQVTDSQLQGIGMSRAEFDAKMRQRDQLREAFLRTLKQGYLFTLKGSTHNTYITDEALIGAVVPGLKDNLATIGGERAATVINAYVAAFFDHFLKESDASLPSQGSPSYPEVELQIYGQPS